MSSIKKEILKSFVWAILIAFSSGLKGQDSNMVFLQCKILIVDTMADVVLSAGPHYMHTKLLLCELDTSDLKRIGLSDCVKNRIVISYASREPEILNEGTTYTILVKIEYLTESKDLEQGSYRSPCSGYVLRENDRVRYYCKGISK